MNSYVLFNSIIGNAFKNVWNSLWLLIDEIVYFLVGKCYEIFSIVSKVSLFGDGTSDAIETLTKRIYVILGVVMLFVFAYNIILIILDPDKLDKKDDKSLGGLAKNLVISIVLISLLPVAFDYINQLQNKLLDSHVIENVFLGGGGTADTSKMGDYTALNIIGAFYHPVDNNGNAVSYYDCVKNSSVSTMCDDYVGAWNYALNSGNVGRDFIRDDKLNDHIEKGDFEYIKIISTVCGVIALLMFVSYTLDIGVRVAKLAILQIIAPIPVILRISKPSGGTFSNWLNELIKTYLSLFVRLLTIYFTVTTIALISEGNVFENIGNIGSNSGASGFVVMLAKVVVILGILKFAKDAPEMLEKMFGVEHLPFSPKDIGKKITSTPILGKPINKAYGAATGALGAMSYAAQNKKIPFGQAVLSGAANGLKKGGSQYSAQRAKTYQAINNKDDGKPNVFGKEPWIAKHVTGPAQKALGNALDEKYDNIIENGATNFVKQGLNGKLNQESNEFVRNRYQAAIAGKARDNYVSQYVKRNYDDHESKIAGYESVFKQRKDYQDTLDKVKSLNANLSEKELRNKAMSEYMKTADFNNSFADAAGIKKTFDESVIQTSKGRESYVQAANTNWDANSKNITDAYIKNGVDTESIITEIASSMTEDEKKSMVSEYEDAVKHGSKKAEKKKNDEFVKNLAEAIKNNADSLKDSGVTTSSDSSNNGKK